MHAPLYSTITLFAELIISAVIYFSIYSGYKKNKFPTIPAALALLYEIIFNISYMAYQAPHHVKAARVEAPFVVALAIVHGVLSLLMFIALIIFFFVAWRKYRQGINYFKEHKKTTFTFLILWTFSIVSGVAFYLIEYVL